MGLYDIDFDVIQNAYKTQMYLHDLLAAEYAKQGLVYGGRSFYTINDINMFIPNVHKDNNGNELGVDGRYRKMIPSIHKKVLSQFYNSILNATNKHIKDKFETIDINKDGLQKIVTVSDALIYDIKTARDWAKKADKILKDFEKRQNNKKKTKKETVLSMRALVELSKIILARSTELCPIETGFLRSSGSVYVFSNYVRIIYKCPYATYVHENVNNYHAIGQAKFLETAAQEMLRNKSVWVAIGTVDGKNYQQEWEHDKYGHAFGTPKWVEKTGYSTVYIDIDRNLNINYAHYGQG